MKDKIIIRRATVSDKDDIRKMIIATDDYYYNNCPSFVKNYNTNPKYYQKQSETFVDKITISDFYIMELNNRVIGTIMEWDNNGETTLINFFVYKQYRGKGYGRMLLDHVIENMKTDYCVLSVYKENKKSVDFYYKYGFKYLQTEETDSGTLLWLRYDK